MSENDSKLDQAGPIAPLSRREWLLNFGSAVILSGFTAVPGEAQAPEHIAAAALPPGLYAPSIDHVTHALNSDGAFFPIPLGAETEYLRPRSGPYSPESFLPQEFHVIRRLVEIILGEDLKLSAKPRAPGAPATIFAEVAEWIDLVVASAPHVRSAARTLTPEQRALAVAYFTSEEPVRELETFEPEAVCRAGLAWLDAEAHRRFAIRFLDVHPDKQIELVSAMSDVRAAAQNDPQNAAFGAHDGTRFFDFLKAETIRAYYTSRVGLEELNYAGNSFYGRSPGCGHATHKEPTK